MFFLRSLPIAEKKLLNFSATSKVDEVLQCCKYDSSIGALVSFMFFPLKSFSSLLYKQKNSHDGICFLPTLFLIQASLAIV